MSVALHLCRGNYRSGWMAAGGYDPVAELMFNQLGVDGFLLEYDDERSGGFAPLRFVPKGKVVVLGLVSSKSGKMESPDELARRIEEAARVVPLDQLALSPQCGFASSVHGNKLSQSDQWKKLGLVVAVAEQVWGRAH
jgi:5-methyltetrahydropteroyltriglutamate--homocysteine methyltransferase